MSLTVRLDENESVRVADEVIETHPPDTVEFVAEGVLTMTAEILERFEGNTLDPEQLTLSVDASRDVPVDFTKEPSLRLEEVDVGVETPDTDDVSSEIDSLSSTTDAAQSFGSKTGAIAFTIEGVLLDVPEETFEQLSEGELTLKSISFAREDVVKSDGGSNDTVLLEFSLLGYGIVIYRDGCIEIGTGGDITNTRLP